MTTRDLPPPQGNLRWGRSREERRGTSTGRNPVCGEGARFDGGAATRRCRAGEAQPLASVTARRWSCLLSTGRLRVTRRRASVRCTRTSPRNEGRLWADAVASVGCSTIRANRSRSKMERKELDTGAVLTVRGHLRASRPTRRRALHGSATTARPPGWVEVGEDASGLRSPQVGPRGQAGDSPARASGCGADDHGVDRRRTPDGRRAATASRRRDDRGVLDSGAFRRGDPAVRDPACEWVRRRSRPAGAQPASRTSEGATGEWSPAGGRRSREGPSFGRASELGSSCLRFTQTVACSGLWADSAWWSSSPDTSVDATSGVNDEGPAMVLMSPIPWACARPQRELWSRVA